MFKFTIRDLLWLTVVVTLAVLGCSRRLPKNEVVMSAGMKIKATTPGGEITITAGNGLLRSYTWDGATRSVEMWPREERWYGSLGLYFPGPGEHWKEHQGITRGVVEEGQQHFNTVAEAQRWIEARTSATYTGGRRSMEYFYRNDGLLVGWCKTPERKQLNVEVWQILINGKKPTDLAGSDDDKIEVEMTTPNKDP